MGNKGRLAYQKSIIISISLFCLYILLAVSISIYFKAFGTNSRIPHWDTVKSILQLAQSNSKWYCSSNTRKGDRPGVEPAILRGNICEFITEIYFWLKFQEVKLKHDNNNHNHNHHFTHKEKATLMPTTSVTFGNNNIFHLSKPSRVTDTTFFLYKARL
jgi:hypothetical protein